MHGTIPSYNMLKSDRGDFSCVNLMYELETIPFRGKTGFTYIITFMSITLIIYDQKIIDYNQNIKV